MMTAKRTITPHFWRFFFAFTAIIAAGVITIYVASLFDGREGAPLKAEAGEPAE